MYEDNFTVAGEQQQAPQQEQPQQPAPQEAVTPDAQQQVQPNEAVQQVQQLDQATQPPQEQPAETPKEETPEPIVDQNFSNYFNSNQNLQMVNPQAYNYNPNQQMYDAPQQQMPQEQQQAPEFEELEYNITQEDWDDMLDNPETFMQTIDEIVINRVNNVVNNVLQGQQSLVEQVLDGRIQTMQAMESASRIRSQALNTLQQGGIQLSQPQIDYIETIVGDQIAPAYQQYQNQFMHFANTGQLQNSGLPYDPNTGQALDLETFAANLAVLHASSMFGGQQPPAPNNGGRPQVVRQTHLPTHAGGSAPSQPQGGAVSEQQIWSMPKEQFSNYLASKGIRLDQ